MHAVYVRDPRSPESGVGLVLEERRDSWDVFFESGLRRLVPKGSAGVEVVDLPRQTALLAAAAAVPFARWAAAHHNVYVVELDGACVVVVRARARCRPRRSGAPMLV